jgi:hypothetical protein
MTDESVDVRSLGMSQIHHVSRREHVFFGGGARKELIDFRLLMLQL